MSIERITSETRFAGLLSLADSDAKARASRVSPAAVLDSSGAQRRSRFLFELSESSIQAISQIAHVRRRPRGAIMFFEGDTARGVYLLCQGRVNMLTVNAKGKTLILKRALPGDVLGLQAVMAGTAHAATVKVMQPCRYAFIARENFLKFIKERTDACLYFAQHLGRDCHSAYDAIRSMCNPVPARLARFLISHGATGTKGGIVRENLALTQETIAQCIGCTRETVSRALSDLKRKGVAELVGTTLRVHDRSALETLSAI